MFSEYLVGKGLDAALKLARKILKEAGGENNKLTATVPEIEESINHHVRLLNGWTKEISFNELSGAKSTRRAFIELDLYVYPRNLRQPNEVIKKIPLTGMFDDTDRHIVLLGQPGSGKTTSMMYMCQALFHDETFYPERFNFPILIRFRDLNGSANSANPQLLIDKIYGILGLQVELPPGLPPMVAAEKMASIKEKLVVTFLEELNVLLLLDGFDELASAEVRKNAIANIKTLAAHLGRCTMVVSSRTADFIYHIDNASRYEISELNEEQIADFALKWLGDKQQADSFTARVIDSPFEVATIRPLTLAHLCAIYERVGEIPEKPKAVYRKIIRLLLQEWDEQRDVKRYSKYANFQVDEKLDFLSHLAFKLTTDLRKTVFSKYDVLKTYQAICREHNLLRGEARQVVTELESHTGLFLQSSDEEFEFAHKSLQEYLTAEYLKGLPDISDVKESLVMLPNELAILVALGSASKYLGLLVAKRLINHHWSEEFIATFVHRLLLERPDFDDSARSGIILVMLYTFYVRYCFYTGKDKSSDVFDASQDTEKLESLVKSALNESSLSIIRNNYEVTSVIKMERGNIFQLHRTKLGQRADGKIMGIDFRLPPMFYLRSSHFYECYS